MFGDREEVSCEACDLLAAALDEETGDLAWRDLVAQALSLVEAFRAENEWT